MASTKRMMVSMTPDMHKALKKKAQEQGATMAGLARRILAEWLEKQGEPVDWIVEYGGKRGQNDR